MDALFVNLFVIILILILYSIPYTTIIYANKRNESGMNAFLIELM